MFYSVRMKQSQEEKIKSLKNRLSQLEATRAKFEATWQETQSYVDNKIISFSDLAAIPTRPKRYSSAPCNYLYTLVSGMIGYSVSDSITWFKLSTSDLELLKLYGVKDFLEAVERVMYARFISSNMYKSMVNFVHDAAVFGHSVLLIEEDSENNSIRYRKLPNNEVYMDINANGEVDTLFRKYLMTLRQCVEFFGENNLDEQLRSDYQDETKWNDNVEIVMAVFPRKDYNPEYRDAENKPYACIYFDKVHNRIIKETGYDDFPFAVFLWDRYDNYAYGSSPSQNALEDCKFLNIAERTACEIAQTSAKPPFKVSENIRQVNIMPGAFTYLDDANSILEAIKTGENYPISLEVKEAKKQDVKDWFYVDFFLMLQSRTRNNMTATEVQELQGEKAATLSNVIVNLNDALQKIIQRTFDISLRQDALPPIPTAIREKAGSLKVEFLGPLAQMQRKYHSMGGTLQALQVMGPIMQLFPNAGDFIDPDELMKTTMEGQGLPQNVIREDEDVKRIRQERIIEQQQQQQQAMQMQMAQNLMQNADKLGKGVEEGSPMEMLNQQLAGGMNG